jgi:hypothetical protein
MSRRRKGQQIFATAAEYIALRRFGRLISFPAAKMRRATEKAMRVHLPHRERIDSEGFEMDSRDGTDRAACGRPRIGAAA